MTPSFAEEEILWSKGNEYIVGIDEVGRGSWAGPVVAAGVIFNKESLHSFITSDPHFLSINDSKKLTYKTRSDITPFIKKNAYMYSIEEVGVEVINEIGIGKATYLAMEKTIVSLYKKLGKENIYILVDGRELPYLPSFCLGQKAIIKGDQKSISIAAASIIAKVYRDTLMEELSLKYVPYFFAKHKGYGTKDHQKAIKEYGLSPIHRRSFNLDKFL